jgi:hypothetical protein
MRPLRRVPVDHQASFRISAALEAKTAHRRILRKKQTYDASHITRHTRPNALCQPRLSGLVNTSNQKCDVSYISVVLPSPTNERALAIRRLRSDYLAHMKKKSFSLGLISLGVQGIVSKRNYQIVPKGG